MRLSSVAGCAFLLLALSSAACSSGLAAPSGSGRSVDTGGGCPGSVLASPACTHTPTAPPGVAPADAAVARARTAAGDAKSGAEVVWAQVQTPGYFRLASHQWTWEVRLQGPALSQPPCPSGYLDGPRDVAASPCLDGDAGIIVVMDAYTLEVLGTGH